MQIASTPWMNSTGLALALAALATSAAADHAFSPVAEAAAKAADPAIHADSYKKNYEACGDDAIAMEKKCKTSGAPAKVCKRDASDMKANCISSLKSMSKRVAVGNAQPGEYMMFHHWTKRECMADLEAALGNLTWQDHFQICHAKCTNGANGECVGQCRECVSQCRTVFQSADFQVETICGSRVLDGYYGNETVFSADTAACKRLAKNKKFDLGACIDKAKADRRARDVASFPAFVLEAGAAFDKSTRIAEEDD